MFESSFLPLISLYVQTFSLTKVKLQFIPIVINSLENILKEISSFFTLLKDFEISLENDKIRSFLENLSRNLCWFLGMTAYKLMKVKDTEKADDKEKKEQS